MNLKNLFLFLVVVGISVAVAGCEGVVTISLNQPPVAILSAQPTQGYAKLKVTFDASQSYDPDGQIVSYKWNFGDGNEAEGIQVTHLFEDDSDFNNDGIQDGYLVTLTVVDDKGLPDSATIRIIVYNPPPIANFNWHPRKPYTFEIVTFDASASYDPAKALGIIPEPSKIINYHWNFGDGKEAEGKVVTHAYTDNGKYLVTLTVTDDDYEIGAKSQLIEVLNRPPVAQFTWHECPVFSPAQPEGIVVGKCLEFDATNSKDEDGWIVDYEWDFGDGSKGKGAIVQHEFLTNPSSLVVYTITLTVKDNDGALDQKKVNIRV